MREVRQAVRSLIRRPTYTLAATLSLAVAIGTLTAVTHVVESVLLRPLGYADAERLVVVGMRSADGSVRGLSFPNLEDVRRRSHTMADLEGARVFPQDLVGEGEPERLATAAVTPGYLGLLGARLHRGRGLVPEDDVRGAARVGVISHALWVRRWGGDPAILERSVTMNRAPLQVVGILDAGFRPPEALGQGQVHVWLPLAFVERGPDPLQRRSDQFLTALGRIAPGTGLSTVSAEMDALGRELAREFPQANSMRGQPRRLGVISLRDKTIGDAARPLRLMLGAVVLLFVAGVANACHLALLRTRTHSRGLWIRRALGASRLHMLRHASLEVLVLLVMAWAPAVTMAATAVHLFRMSPARVPRMDELSLDAHLLLIGAAAALLAGVIVVGASAWDGSRRLLREGRTSFRTSDGRWEGRTRGVLVVLETGVALALLATAGVFLVSLVRLQHVDLGYDTANVYTIPVFVGGWYATSTERFTIYEDLMRELAHSPQVERAGVSTALPLGGFAKRIGVHRDASEKANRQPEVVAGLSHVSPGYFRTLGIELLPGGRLFESDDLRDGSNAAIISASLADSLYGGDAVGGTLQMGSLNGPRAPLTIVGVVGNVRYRELAGEESHEVYLPHHGGFIGPALNVFVRSDASLESLAPALRAAVQRTRADLPIGRIAPLTERVGNANLKPRLTAGLLGFFASIALVLGLIGIYGTVSLAVRQRGQELGVRIAVGASRSQVVRLVMRWGLVLTVGGMLLGGALAWLASRFVGSYLYAVTPMDPSTMAVASAFFLVVHLLAAYVPTRRITEQSLMTTLREE